MGGRGGHPFDQVDPEHDLTQIGFTFNGCAANHTRVCTLHTPEAQFLPARVGKVRMLLLSPRRDLGLGKIARRGHITKRDDLLRAANCPGH